MNLRRAISWFIVLVLLCAAINPLFATYFIKSRTASKGKTVLNVIGPEATLHDWPAPTPHAIAWPVPHQYSESRSFGFHRIDVWGTGSKHQMVLERIGWPIPVFERVQMWWPWTDPVWQIDVESDPALQLYWPGVEYYRYSASRITRGMDRVGWRVAISICRDVLLERSACFY